MFKIDKKKVLVMKLKLSIGILFFDKKSGYDVIFSNEENIKNKTSIFLMGQSNISVLLSLIIKKWHII